MTESMALDPRKAFSKALMDIGSVNPRVLILSCDSASGSGMSDFVAAYPDRYVEVGISEQTAIGISAGLAYDGFIPVISAIAPFISMRCFEQVRVDVGYANMNVKIIGSSSGLSHSTLGTTHQAIEDLTLMRTVANMLILNPGDAFEVEMSLKEAVRHTGPVYIRMPRHKLHYINPSDNRTFELGKGQELLKGSDITILTTGTVGYHVRRAAERLNEEGISTGVINFPTVRPLDKDLIKSAFGKTKLFVTVEEHSVTAGFGGEVAEFLATEDGAPRLVKLGIPEGSTVNGPYDELMEYHGLFGEPLYENLKRLAKEA